VLFYSYGDKIKQDFFINRMGDATEKENAATKLAQMVDFCQSPACRRRFLLDYFAEDFPDDGCGGCDVCLTPREEFDATEIAQKILSAVVRTGQRFGMNHVIGVLQGAGGERIRNNGHDQLSVYGIAADHSQDDLRETVGLLVAQGLLVKSDGQYPTLAVSQAGRRFLQRRETLTLARPRRSPQPAAFPPEGQLDYDKTLFEELRSSRRVLADSRGVPPYVVFSDASLQEMAYYLPQSLDSFSRINGVGQAKLSEYGESFLSVIRRHAETHGLTERPIPSRRERRSGRRAAPGDGDSSSPSPDSPGPPRRPGPTYYETKGLLEQGLTIYQVAQQRGLGEGTIINHLERLVMAGEKLDLAHLLPPPEHLAKIESAFNERGTQFLAPVREALGEGYSYEELRLVRLHLRRRGGEAPEPR
jgi:ATP-dependent DNA helicase RecQ